MAVTRAGQFFLVGTLLFAAMITGIVVLNQGSSITFTGSPVAKTAFERGMDEAPRAVNSALQENATAREVRRRVASYLGFHSYAVGTHGVTAREHVVIALPNSTGVTAIVGNARGAEMTGAAISLDGTERSLSSIADGETRTVPFPGAAGKFRVTFNASADRTINNSFTASRDGAAALYSLRVAGEDQVWTETRVY
ncbi:MAG: hypothetical protein SVU88_00630 [Candidatus Nanohaloarchaea archaeon]|nr:hypothetical protein [Candidatus Nanohaloarchaea archaeon]